MGKQQANYPHLHMILYMEQPKESTARLRTDTFSAVAGYKVNLQNLVAFLYATTSLLRKESRHTKEL